MNCEQLVQYLSDYIDNDLDLELSEEAREHLATCRNCHIMLDTTRKTITLCQTCSPRVIPQDRREVLMNRLQSALKERMNY
jgi:hypothetical protein